MKNLLLKELEKGVALLQVNRPEVLNALNKETLEELLDFFEGEKKRVSVESSYFFRFW